MSKFGDNRITPEHLRKNLPGFWKWVWDQERFVLGHGVLLAPTQVHDAWLAGIVHPDRVRLLRVEQIPVPSRLVLRAIAEDLKLITPTTPGFAMRYGIFIRSPYWGDRHSLVLQLAHTAQYERLGSIPAFLECYLHERLFIGDSSSPMEQAAISIARRICGPEPVLNTPKTPQVARGHGQTRESSQGTSTNASIS